jgi:hypothetical protein
MNNVGKPALYNLTQPTVGTFFLENHLLCFSAIAYPRGGGKFIRYGIFDQQKYEIEFITLEGYMLPYGINK